MWGHKQINGWIPILSKHKTMEYIKTYTVTKGYRSCKLKSSSELLLKLRFRDFLRRLAAKCNFRTSRAFHYLPIFHISFWNYKMHCIVTRLNCLSNILFRLWHFLWAEQMMIQVDWLSYKQAISYFISVLYSMNKIGRNLVPNTKKKSV